MGAGDSPALPLPLLRSRFLSRLLRSSLLLRRPLCMPGFRLRSLGLSRLHLLRLGFLLRQFRSLEGLPASRNLRDAHRGVRLPMPAQLLVLFLALVMEDQNFRAAALFDDFAYHPRVRLQAHSPSFARNRQHWKLHHPVRPRNQLLHSYYISRRHPVLLSTGADNRVHTHASTFNVSKSARQNLLPRTL